METLLRRLNEAIITLSSGFVTIQKKSIYTLVGFLIEIFQTDAACEWDGCIFLTCSSKSLFVLPQSKVAFLGAGAGRVVLKY